MQSGSVDALLAALRAELRRRRITARDLAARMNVAEPTMRRWLHGKGLLLDRLDQLCRAAGLDLRDLASGLPDNRPGQFTFAQERALAADRALSFLFFALLNGAEPESFQREFKLPRARIETYLQALHRIGLIEYEAGKRIRVLTTRNVAWRPAGPLSKAFEASVRHFFLSMDFSAPDAAYVSDMVRVSSLGRARLHALFRAMRLEAIKIAQEDQEANLSQYEWTGLLMLAHPFDMSKVTDADDLNA
jgi:transcriptional regulator with XRE-family HTH domain